MTARARGAAGEQRFSSGGIPGDGARGTPASRSGLKTADIGDELPDLRIAQIGKRRHLGPAHPGPDRSKQIRVAAAVRERAGGQRRSAVAALGARTMARLTELAVEGLSRGHCSRAGGQGVGAAWRRGLLATRRGGIQDSERAQEKMLSCSHGVSTTIVLNLSTCGFRL